MICPIAASWSFPCICLSEVYGGIRSTNSFALAARFAAQSKVRAVCFIMHMESLKHSGSAVRVGYCRRVSRQERQCRHFESSSQHSCCGVPIFLLSCAIQRPSQPSNCGLHCSRPSTDYSGCPLFQVLSALCWSTSCFIVLSNNRFSAHFQSQATVRIASLTFVWNHIHLLARHNSFHTNDLKKRRTLYETSESHRYTLSTGSSSNDQDTHLLTFNYFNPPST
jgi:hypothetical protein